MSANSIFRKSFIFPFIALSTLLTFYFIFFFELHLKYIFEKSLFESLGTEVNISKLDISPFKESFSLNRIQFTDPDKPTQNIFEIRKVLVTYNTKKLLDLSFQSELVDIEEIRFHTKRKNKGKVLSKDKRLIVIKDPSAHKISSALEDRFDQNSFLKLTKSLKGNLSKKELSKFTQSFKSAKFYENLASDELKIKSQIKDFEESLESQRVKNVLEKIKNFKFESGSTNESLASTAKSLKLIKETEELKKELKREIKSINNQIKTMTSKAKQAPKSLKNDLLMLKNDYKSLDPSTLSQEIFGGYFALQISKMSRFKEAMTDSAYDQVKQASSVDVKKHLVDDNNTPDNSDTLAPKENEKNEDSYSRGKLEERRNQLISSNGRWFNFKKNPEPKFWIKKISISSKASKGQDIGDVNGEIINLTSDPDIILKPLTVDITGSAPKQDIGFFSINGVINKINPSAEKQEFDVKVADYKIKDFEVFSDNDAFLNFKESQAQTVIKFIQSVDTIDLKLTQTLKPSVASFKSDNKNVSAILKEVSTLSPLNLELLAKGNISNPRIKIDTNIVKKLLKSIEDTGKNLAKTKVNEEIEKIQNKFLSEYLPKVNKSSSSLNQQSLSLNKRLSSLFDDEISKLKSKSKKSKNKDIDKLKNKLLDKIKF